MKNACSVDNVIGQIVGLEYTKGTPSPVDLLDNLTPTEKSRLTDVVNSVDSGFFDEVLIDDPNFSRVNDYLGSMTTIEQVKHKVKKIMVDNTNPNQILGDELIDEMQGIIDDHLNKYGFVYSKEAKKVFKEEMNDLFDNWDVSDYTPDKQAYFREMAHYYGNEGGSLYAYTMSSGIGDSVSTISNNAIKSSSTVLLGNPLEIAYKLPALYGAETGAALKKYSEGGYYLKKIPELEAAGGYFFKGIEEGIKGKGSWLHNWEGINAGADIPTKNLVYLAGAERGGHAGGMKALEDVLFTPRLANIPRQRWHAAGRNEVRLLNYTINSYKLGANLISNVITNKNGMRAASMKSLAIIGGMQIALGGPASLIPQPLEDAIIAIAPDTEEEFSKYKWFASDLIQLGGVGRIGVGYDMAGSTFKNTKNSAKKSLEAFNDGKAAEGLLLGASALMPLLSITDSIAGDAQVQRLVKDVFYQLAGEMENDPTEEYIKDIFPFLNKGVLQQTSEFIRGDRQDE